MTIMTMVQALNAALRSEMKRDKNVILLGEDVGKDGGVFRVTEGLWQEFGDERVLDTPLSESGIVGTSLGLSLAGFRPVAEIQFMGFDYPAFDQIISHVSRIRNRSRGRYSCPLVVRMPSGGGIKALEHHSESTEGIYLQAPGVKVVMPATPTDAKGLLAAAIRDPDPVIFLEPKKLYRSIKEDVKEEDYLIPLGKARLAREGKHVTLVSWGAMVHVCLDAAEKSKEKGIDVEVIDLRTVWPFDRDMIVQSVKKTNRVVLVHEGQRAGGVGGEIAALLAEKNILDLAGPIIRIAGWDVVYPLAKLENYFLPDAARVMKGIEKVMEF